MFRRLFTLSALLLLVVSLAACHKTNKRVTNPLADVGSKQPDKVLFDRALDQMKHNHMDQARIILQTLINTYPDSEYIARAKLAVGDSWYAEGSTAALAQAENEYRDFETFFPNLPEAAEAQLKIANIHYRQMEKPDRDFTHAVRAEEEYRNLVQQYPDSKLVPEAKQRLREVQEVLAERQFRIGRFYYMREAWPAAIARLQTLVNDYPLYSGADEALYMLGSIYERQLEAIRASRFKESIKGQLLRQVTEKAGAEYGRIITRYPLSERADEARKRLEALHLPVPTPTPEAIAQNKAEEASRRELGRFGKLMLNMHRQPDTSMAARVGEPSLSDPKPVNAPDIVRDNTMSMIRAATQPASSSSTLSVETVKPGEGAPGQPPPNQPPPRSDTQPAATGDSVPELRPLPAEGAGTEPPAPAPAQAAPPLPPTQINEAAPDQANSAKTDAGSSQASASSSSSSDKAGDKDVSSSKKKKKKGLGKLNPF